MIEVKPYIDKQIELEAWYYDYLTNSYTELIKTLSTTISTSPSKRAILAKYNLWLRHLGVRFYNANAKYAMSLYGLVKDTLPSLATNVQATKDITYDLRANTDNLSQSIYGRFMTLIPVGIGLVSGIIEFSDIEEAMNASYKSIKLMVQTSTSQAVGNLIANTAISNGYVEYQGGNEQDDKVREQHRIDNDFETWHFFASPPLSGLVGSEWHCRCFYTRLR